MLQVLIIMKNRTIMKRALITLAIWIDRFDCWKERANISKDHKMMGKVSSSDLPMLRGRIGPDWRIRALIAMCFSSNQHHQSKKRVIDGDEHRCHPCNCRDSFVAAHAG